MLTISAIVTDEKEYLDGFRSVRALKNTLVQNANVILDETSDPNDFKPEFVKASLPHDIQKTAFPAKSISLIRDDILGDDDSFKNCSIVLRKGEAANSASLFFVDEDGFFLVDDNKDPLEVPLNHEDIAQACKIQQDLDRDSMVAGGQRVTGDDIPLIKLIEEKSGNMVIGNRDELRDLSNFIYHGVLGTRMEEFIQRGLDFAANSRGHSPAPVFQ